jgi:hypothetical protein
MFRKLDLFPSSGEVKETPTVLCPLQIVKLNHSTTQDKVKVTLKLMVSQSVCLGVEPSPRFVTRCLLLF